MRVNTKIEWNPLPKRNQKYPFLTPIYYWTTLEIVSCVSIECILSNPYICNSEMFLPHIFEWLVFKICLDIIWCIPQKYCMKLCQHKLNLYKKWRPRNTWWYEVFTCVNNNVRTSNWHHWEKVSATNLRCLNVWRPRTFPMMEMNPVNRLFFLIKVLLIILNLVLLTNCFLQNGLQKLKLKVLPEVQLALFQGMEKKLFLIKIRILICFLCFC